MKPSYSFLTSGFDILHVLHVWLERTPSKAVPIRITCSRHLDRGYGEAAGEGDFGGGFPFCIHINGNNEVRSSNSKASWRSSSNKENPVWVKKIHAMICWTSESGCDWGGGHKSTRHIGLFQSVQSSSMPENNEKEVRPKCRVSSKWQIEKLSRYR